MKVSKISEAPNIGVAAALQWRQAKGPQPNVDCASCDVPAPMRFRFRCLYCGLWFCQACGEVHFGETRGERAGRLAHEGIEEEASEHVLFPVELKAGRDDPAETPLRDKRIVTSSVLEQLYGVPAAHDAGDMILCWPDGPR
jgi:hypothetical protein